MTTDANNLDSHALDLAFIADSPILSLLSESDQRRARRLALGVSRYINSSPDLMSLLYDLDLMPEQCPFLSSKWKQMAKITLHWKAHHRKTINKMASTLVDALNKDAGCDFSESDSCSTAVIVTWCNQVRRMM